MLRNKEFWLGTLERAVKTFAQAFITLAVAKGLGETVGVADVDWLALVNVAGGMAVLSIMTSFSGLGGPASAPKTVVPPAPVAVDDHDFSEEEPFGSNQELEVR